MFLRRLVDVTKKTSFLRCIWDVLRTSQKSRLFWDVSERYLRCLSQWRSDWGLSETSHAGWGRTSLKQKLPWQTFLSTLGRCLPSRGFNSKFSKFKVRLFFIGTTLTRIPPHHPPYLTMGKWNGEKEVSISGPLSKKRRVTAFANPEMSKTVMQL